MTTNTSSANSLIVDAAPEVASVKRSRFSLYRELSKSGIVTLVLISVLGGYLIGHPAEQAFDFTRLLSTLVGILLVSSGSSALNQYQERLIDARMPRTAQRPLPSGRMSEGQVLRFVVATIVVGQAILATISVAQFVLGAVAVISYNGLYTLWWKKRWAFAAIPGAVPGALPALMGFAAASGSVFTTGGVYLFFILFFWQMPHFWVLALRYRGDYEKGGIPTLPVALGSEVTVFQIVLWSLGYSGLILIGPLFLPTGAVYQVVAVLTCLMVLKELRGFIKAPESKSWLRFFLGVNFSLIMVIFGAAADLWWMKVLTPYLIR